MNALEAMAVFSNLCFSLITSIHSASKTEKVGWVLSLLVEVARRKRMKNRNKKGTKKV